MDLRFGQLSRSFALFGQQGLRRSQEVLCSDDHTETRLTGYQDDDQNSVPPSLRQQEQVDHLPRYHSKGRSDDLSSAEGLLDVCSRYHPINVNKPVLTGKPQGSKTYRASIVDMPILVVYQGRKERPLFVLSNRY